MAVFGKEHYDAVMPLATTSLQPSSDQPLHQPSLQPSSPGLNPCSHASSDRPSRSPRRQAHYISPNMKEKFRKREKSEVNWKKNVRKRLRLGGKEYTDSRGSTRPVKKIQTIDCSKCRFQCQKKFTEEERNIIFTEYYKIDSVERKHDYLCAHIEEGSVSRTISSKKSVSRKYFFQVSGKKDRVCQSFFLRTLDISHKSVSGALLKMREGRLYSSKDQRRKHIPHNKSSESTVKCVCEHINSYPKLDPHYTRKDTSRQFLEQNLNIRRMHAMYLETAAQEHKVSEKVYRSIFNTKFNLSFHIPKKDQCNNCSLFKQKELSSNSEDDVCVKYREHQERKTTARNEKNRDKIRAKEDPNFESATFDLQAILSTPCGLISQLYYKRKPSSYNLSFNSQSNGQGICYLWDETDGSKGSSEVATCLCLYLNSIRHPITSVSLFSDTCGGQNKNKNVCVALLNCVNQHPSLTTVDQKFFEPGHSCMESDSMHSAIETAKRKTQVHVPSQ